MRETYRINPREVLAPSLSEGNVWYLFRYNGNRNVRDEVRLEVLINCNRQRAIRSNIKISPKSMKEIKKLLTTIKF